MSIQNPNSRRSVFRAFSVVCAVLGLWWGGGMLLTLGYGFAERDGYHRREFEEALPMLSLLTIIGISFLVAAWFFWRASRRCATHTT
jgi:hypothetical protein